MHARNNRRTTKPLRITKMKDFTVVIPERTTDLGSGSCTIQRQTYKVQASGKLDAFNKALSKYREEFGIPSNVAIFSESVTQVQHEIGAIR